MSDGSLMRDFEDKVKSTIEDYDLIKGEDKVLVAVSGGKDSTTALYILHKLGYDVQGLIIDQLLGEYSKVNLDNIKCFCRLNDIVLHVVHMRDEYGCSVCYMKSVLDSRGHTFSSCTICGVIRRSLLNRKARELNATKVATGHNMDDEAQTLFMNLVRGSIRQSARLGPKTGVTEHRKFVARIKPLYFCLESETERYSRMQGFPVDYDPCPCSADSFRTHIKELLNEVEKSHPGAKRSIVEGFLELIPHLKQEHIGFIKECSVCGEPSSGDVCRVCGILNNLKPE